VVIEYIFNLCKTDKGIDDWKQLVLDVDIDERISGIQKIAVTFDVEIKQKFNSFLQESRGDLRKEVKHDCSKDTRELYSQHQIVAFILKDAIKMARNLKGDSVSARKLRRINCEFTVKENERLLMMTRKDPKILNDVIAVIEQERYERLVFLDLLKRTREHPEFRCVLESICEEVKKRIKAEKKEYLARFEPIVPLPAAIYLVSSYRQDITYAFEGDYLDNGTR